MMPTSVKIGTQIYSVLVRPEAEDGMLITSLGYTAGQHNLIVIREDLSVSKRRQTLMHEILHALAYEFGSTATPKHKAEADEWEHYFIGMWEEPLVMLLRDNPKLVQYFTSKDTE